MIRLLLFMLVATGMVGAVTPGWCAADRDAVLAALFPESVLSDNGPQLLLDAETRSPIDRYERLCQWVLPTEYRGFRVRGWFSDPRRSKQGNSIGGRQPVGGELESAAFALIQSAIQTGRQDDLAQKITSAEVKSQADQRSQAALLALLALNSDSPSDCFPHVQTLLDRVLASPAEPVATRWPELLVADRLSKTIARVSASGSASSLDPARVAMEELLLELQPQARSDEQNAQSAHWLRLLFELGADEQVPHRSPFPKHALQNWHAVDRVDQASLSTGRPLGRWQLRDRQVTCISSHACESLYYDTPLRGNFRVEAEVSSSLDARGHFAWGGFWVAVPDEAHVLTGRYWSGSQSTNILPPLADIDEWSRYRIDVQNQVVSVWWNGRLVQQHPVTNNSDPWLSIRNMSMHNSSVRNVRITGEPTIPAQIELLSGSDLPAWNSFYSSNQWKQTGEPESELVSERMTEFRGNVFAPSLLYYHRPMLEDGVIDYEFFYKPETMIVHPAIGDIVLLLNQNGVQLHQTDADGSRIQSRVGAAGDLPNKQLPLHDGEWNQARVSLVGDTVELSINGQAVKTLELTTGNRRTFGLFHFVDQTTARVRNIIWKGNWSRHLPKLGEQELANPPPEFFAELDELTEVIDHDFATLGVPQKRFESEGHALQTAILEESDGVRVTPLADGTWRGVWLKLKEPMYGDFDAILEFQDLRFDYGSSDYLDFEVRGIDSSGQEFKSTRQLHETLDQFFSKRDEQMPDGSWASSYIGIRDESTSGRLRLVRRGDTCHMLISHQDSPNFHYCGSQQMLSADSAMRVEVLVKNAGGGSTSVLLKSLRIRSNSRAVAASRDLRIAGLETYIHRLKDVNARTFSINGIHDFETSGGVFVTDDGLQTTAPNADEDSILTWKPVVQGDFDISVSIDAKQLQSGNAELQFATREEGSLGIQLSVLQDGQLRIGGGTTTQDIQDIEPYVFDRDSQLVDLRLIRIQKTLFLIYSHDGKTRLLGSHDFSDGPGQIRLQSRSGTGPANVTWVKFRSRREIAE